MLSVLLKVRKFCKTDWKDQQTQTWASKLSAAPYLRKTLDLPFIDVKSTILEKNSSDIISSAISPIVSCSRNVDLC